MMKVSALPAQSGILQLRLVRRHVAPEPQRVRTVSLPSVGTTVRGRFTGKPGRFAQRVMVKVKYRAAHNGRAAFKRSLRDNAKYITRDGDLAGFDQTGQAATREDINAATQGWSEDNRYYKFILSPENGHRLDLQDYTRQVMAKVERDLLSGDEVQRGVGLKWFAVEHWDTDHPHVHVMMRARVESRNLRLSNGYASHGLRARAREVATQQLGYRLERGTDLEEKRRVVLERRRHLGLDPGLGTPPRQQQEPLRGREGGLD